MSINLNKSGALTMDSVRQLLASASDDTRTQLCVTKDGIAFIAKLSRVESDNPSDDDLLFKVERWLEGTGYVGKKASKDDEWVERIYRVLDTNWPTPSAFIIDHF